jgi:hypothetical protein
VAWLPPELEIGEEPELKPLEPESERDEPEEPELGLDELEPAEPELVPDELEPELAEEFGEPADVEPAELVVWVEPGRTMARAPAVTTLAMVTAVVVERTLDRPRSLAARAWRIPSSRRALLMSLIMRSGARESLHEPSA